MLAYVFWHRPSGRADRLRYEQSLLQFQRALTLEPPPGFVAATSFQIEAVPWLSGQPGYEDWYLLDGSWALDPLNAAAIAGRRRTSHDDAAALMDEGHGGVYAHVGGQPFTAAVAISTVHWLTRPRGIDWRAALAPLQTTYPQATVWRRQMVLGPAAEFAVEAPEGVEIEVPSGWQARAVRRLRLPA